MSKEFSFTTELEYSVADVHAALTSEEYWKGRVADGENSAVELDVPAGPGTLRAVMTDRTEPSALPAVVRGILRGPLEMQRTDNWGALAGDRAEGTLSGGANGLPIEIAATSLLRAGDTGGSVIELNGTVTVKVPVVGGQIEGLLLQMVENIVNVDKKVLEHWLSNR
ncbi:MAG: DUF2505 domain-containing protein [Rhodococcus sp.]|uniref:DUF2505 domain-containing protein n=1 Tax=Rhodococcus sp. TaxID=1831 RepID=UPI0016B07A77|nr:DUF2505 domain-containing protein [Rhodococcus sp. (in: high G+C Gram-positive bacteria)]NLV77812.1 DUF2505 domain-containing protein [Rhodococcus sp. (in: high G+C Gram-positive bacteria)]